MIEVFCLSDPADNKQRDVLHGAVAERRTQQRGPAQRRGVGHAVQVRTRRTHLAGHHGRPAALRPGMSLCVSE